MTSLLSVLKYIYIHNSSTGRQLIVSNLYTSLYIYIIYIIISKKFQGGRAYTGLLSLSIYNVYSHFTSREPLLTGLKIVGLHTHKITDIPQDGKHSPLEGGREGVCVHFEVNTKTKNKYEGCHYTLLKPS